MNLHKSMVIMGPNEGRHFLLPEWLRRHFLLPSRAPFGFYFGDILVTLGSLLVPRGALREVLEGSKNEVEKKDPPKECETLGKGGVPYSD